MCLYICCASQWKLCIYFCHICVVYFAAFNFCVLYWLVI